MLGPLGKWTKLYKGYSLSTLLHEPRPLLLHTLLYLPLSLLMSYPNLPPSHDFVFVYSNGVMVYRIPPLPFIHRLH